MYKSLTELANYHASDKGTSGPSNTWPVHNYTDVYDAYLNPLRERSLTMLEIGLGVTGENWHSAIVHGRNSGGASLKMWYDYFPNATIFGLDINPCPYLDNDRIKTFVGRQGEREELEEFSKANGNPRFDLIFDDGSHRPDDQQISLDYFFKLLKPGGIYFIEDMMANGKGDKGSGRWYCDEVINTRAILKSFRNAGSFPQPNLFSDPGYLARAIESICFHVPKVSSTFRNGRSFWRRGVPGITYQPESERLCMIRKRADVE
jgi:hypothetical protein